MVQMSSFEAKSTLTNMPAMLLMTVALWLSGYTGAIADVRITVTNTAVEHEISPNNGVQRTNRTMSLVLTTDHKLNVKVEYGGATVGGIVVLGKFYRRTDMGGSSYLSRWTIKNGAIMQVSRYESFSMIQRITTNGVDTCQATVDFVLANGHKLFEERRMSNHEDMKVSDMHSENITCSIASLDK